MNWRLNELHELFIDASVDTGNFDDNLNDRAIRRQTDLFLFDVLWQKDHVVFSRL
jgi:hypothetical protein